MAKPGATVTDDDKAWRQLRRDLGLLAKGAITVGIHGDAGKHGADDLTNAELGAIHEFGTDTIPRRSFLEDAFTERASDVAAIMDRAVAAVVLGGASGKSGGGGVAGTLDLAAQQLAGLVQTRMAEGLEPPLGPAATEVRTKRLPGGRPANPEFGGDKPLILSGQLRQSILGRATVHKAAEE